MQHRYTEEQLREAVASSTSIAQVLKKLHIIPAGGNYRTVKKYIAKAQIDTLHFTGQLWSKGKTLPQFQVPLTDYLQNLRPITSHTLKKKLLAQKYLEHICDTCKGITWLDNPIPLELHHRDGNYENNKLENIQLLCPNCHTLTDNYRGKGKTPKS